MSELGAFLRARRERLRPADVGLPDGARRRTPGLRREELAALAGVSVDYYTRLEQGRERRPSESVVGSLARALRLVGEERALLRALAGTVAGDAARPPEPEVGPGLTWLLETVRPAPAYVLNRVSDVLDCNPEGVALLPGLGDWPRDRWNTVRYVFLHPPAREVFGDWDRSAHECVAHLRSVMTADPGAEDLAALVGELSAESTVFAELWSRWDVRGWSGKEKRFRHPAVGEIALRSETLLLPGGTGRFVVYRAEPGTADFDAVARLAGRR